MTEAGNPSDRGGPQNAGDTLEELAIRRVEEAHDAWVREILALGRDSAAGPCEAHAHPFLVPFARLPAAEKNRCARLAGAVLELFRCRVGGAAEGLPSPAETLVEHLHRDLSHADLGETLELWQALKAVADPLPAEIFRDFGHHTLRLGEPLLAYDMLTAGLQYFPREVRLRQLLALALLRSGATFQAIKMLEELREEGQPSEETLGLLARAYKDLAEQTADPAEQRQQWRKAKEIYAASYLQTGGYWTGINAATMARLLGEEAEADSLALQVKRQCLACLENLEAKDAERYWLFATLGEASLIRGEIEEALSWYRKAGEIVGKRYGDLASTRRNLRLLCDALELGVRVRKSLHACLKVPRVVVFSGHMIDQPGRPFPRFPPQLEGRVARELDRLLEKLEARIGYASAACGADILFLEAMLRRQGEINIILPFKKEAFRKTSVDLIPGQSWGDRFEKVLQRATRVVVACDHRSTGSPVIYEYANLLQDGLAVLRARLLESEVVPVVVWDGQPGDDSGGTASMVEHWQKQGRQPEIIDLSAMLSKRRQVPPVRQKAPPAPAGAPLRPPLPQEIRAMLFADVVHYSHLLEEQIPGFMQHFMGAMRAFLAEFGTKPLAVNTWGDALHCVFATVAEAGNFALGLRDRLSIINWSAQGLPDHLNLRISLHAGPVYVWDNPVFSGLRYSGSHVSRAARIEPITPPGQVYASQQFAALATSLGIKEFTCDYVGQIPLPKQAGIIPLYLVRRPHL